MNVKYIPGRRTLKNFLAASLRPAGQVLYIYGGGWNYDDTGGDESSVQIGLSKKWETFFGEQNEEFSYEDYRINGYNKYHDLGLDCSGFIGWAVYNTMNTTGAKTSSELQTFRMYNISGQRTGQRGKIAGTSCVVRASEMAWRYAKEYGWGAFCGHTVGCESFQPGDIFSMDGHVWICIGVCRDRSLVILHSTPSPSRLGCPGGGVQLGAVGETTDCQAYQLASYYMRTFCPEWSRRYEAVLKDPEQYTKTGCEKCGRFRWFDDARGLRDPDGVAHMEAAEVLNMLF